MSETAKAALTRTDAPRQKTSELRGLRDPRGGDRAWDRSETPRPRARHAWPSPSAQPAAFSVAVQDPAGEAEADRAAARVGSPVAPTHETVGSSVGAPGSATPVPGLKPRLELARGEAQPLAREDDAFFGERLGHDFAQVKIHAGPASASAASSVGAQAFTIGRDIYFGAGQYRPATSPGRELIAHELAHTAQNRPNVVSRRVLPGAAVDPASHDPTLPEIDESQASAGVDPQIQAPGVQKGPGDDDAIKRHLLRSKAKAQQGEPEPSAPTPSADRGAAPKFSVSAPPQPRGVAVPPKPAAPGSAAFGGPLTDQATEPPTQSEAPAAKEPQAPPAPDARPEATDGAEPAPAPAVSEEQDGGDGSPRLSDLLASPASGSETAQTGEVEGASTGGAREKLAELAQQLEDHLSEARRGADDRSAGAVAKIRQQAAGARASAHSQIAQAARSIDSGASGLLTDLDSMITSGQSQIEVARKARASEADDKRVERRGKTEGLFTGHRKSVEKTVSDKVEAAETLKNKKKEKAQKRNDEDKKTAYRRGGAKMNSYPGTMRGAYIGGAAFDVAEAVALKIKEQEPEVLSAVDDLIAPLPQYFRESGKKALDGFDVNLPKILDGIDAGGRATAGDVNKKAGEASQGLGQMGERARTDISQAAQAAVTEVNALGPQVDAQIDAALGQALAVARQSPRQAVERAALPIEEAIEEFRSAESGDVEAASQLTEGLTAFLDEGVAANGAALDKLVDASGTRFAKIAAGAGRVLKSDHARAEKFFTNSKAEAAKSVQKKVDGADATFAGTISAFDAECEKGDGKIKEQLTPVVDKLDGDFQACLDDAERKIDDRIAEGFSKNAMALQELGRDMEEAAQDAAFHYDHPIVAGALDGLEFLGGLIAGILGVLIFILVIMVIAEVLGVSALVVGVAFLAFSIGFAIGSAFGARLAAGQGVGEAFTGALGDFAHAAPGMLYDMTGIPKIVKAFSSERMRPGERGELLGEGGTELVLALLMVRGAVKGGPTAYQNIKARFRPPVPEFVAPKPVALPELIARAPALEPTPAAPPAPATTVVEPVPAPQATPVTQPVAAPQATPTAPTLEPQSLIEAPKPVPPEKLADVIDISSARKAPAAPTRAPEPLSEPAPPKSGPRRVEAPPKEKLADVIDINSAKKPPTSAPEPGPAQKPGATAPENKPAEVRDIRSARPLRGKKPAAAQPQSAEANVQVQELEPTGTEGAVVRQGTQVEPNAPNTGQRPGGQATLEVRNAAGGGPKPGQGAPRVEPLRSAGGGGGQGGGVRGGGGSVEGPSPEGPVKEGPTGSAKKPSSRQGFEPKSRVTHEKYGDGTVVRSAGGKTTVRFDGGKEVTFADEFGKLEPTTRPAPEPAKAAEPAKAEAPKTPQAEEPGKAAEQKPASDPAVEEKRASLKEQVEKLRADRERAVEREQTLRDRIERARSDAEKAQEEGEAAAAARPRNAGTRQAAEAAKERIDAAKARRARAEAELPKAEENAREAQRRLSQKEREQHLFELKSNPKAGEEWPCFSGDTLVWTDLGPKPIATIVAGDFVRAFDFEDQTAKLRRVKAAFVNATVHFYDLRLDDEILSVTGRHRFWLPERCEWVMANSLRAGDELLHMDGSCRTIASVTYRDIAQASSYDLNVEDLSNYFVGLGVLAHNTGGKLPFGDNLVYRGTNPNAKFKGKFYIGKTNDRDIREGAHQAEARRNLARDDLSPKEREFWEFKEGMELKPEMEGLREDQATYFEQKKITVEAQRDRANLMNRDLVEVSEPRMKTLEQQIANDAMVREQGLCPP